jgi:hypothetical protein
MHVVRRLVTLRQIPVDSCSTLNIDHSTCRGLVVLLHHKKDISLHLPPVLLSFCDVRLYCLVLKGSVTGFAENGVQGYSYKLLTRLSHWQFPRLPVF